MHKNEGKLWPIAVWIEMVLGLGVPGLMLTLSGVNGDWHAGALPAGALSVAAVAVSTCIRRFAGYPWVTELSRALVLMAVPLGLVVWGAGMPPLVAFFTGVALVAGAVVRRFYRDMTVLVPLVLGLMALCSLVLVGTYGAWPAAAVSGGFIAIVAVAVYYIGQGVFGGEWRATIPMGLGLAAMPVGLLLWGAGMEWLWAIFLAFLVAAAGVVVKLAQKDWAADDYDY